MRYSEVRGTLIYEKNLKSKISCQTPFKAKLITVQQRQALYSSRLYRMLLIELSTKSLFRYLLPLLGSNDHVLESTSNDVRSNNFVLYKWQNYVKTHKIK
jgi:hypothetical protein